MNVPLAEQPAFLLSLNRRLNRFPSQQRSGLFLVVCPSIIGSHVIPLTLHKFSPDSRKPCLLKSFYVVIGRIKKKEELENCFRDTDVAG